MDIVFFIVYKIYFVWVFFEALDSAKGIKKGSIMSATECADVAAFTFAT